MTTARDICKAVLRKLHVLGQGHSVPNDELNDVLRNINDMLATWSVEGNLVFTEDSNTFPLTSAATYTIGSGQDFDTDRMLHITSAYVTQGQTDYTLESYDQAEYAMISNKTLSGIPQIFYYDENYPVANISFYPVPTSVTSVTLNTEKPLTSFADLDTVYALPPEYRAAIIYNAAVWVAPEYEKEPTRSVVRIANRTKKAVQSQNARNNKNISYLGIPPSESYTYTSDILRGY